MIKIKRTSKCTGAFLNQHEYRREIRKDMPFALCVSTSGYALRSR